MPYAPRILFAIVAKPVSIGSSRRSRRATPMRPGRSSGRRALTCALALALLPGIAAAQETDSAVQACMRRDTSTAWREVRRAWQDGPGARWADDSLRQVLTALGRRDQSVRAGPNLADSMARPDFRRRMARTDSSDAKALQAIIDRYGWPTRSLVGTAGADAAFLIAQHNRSLQPEALRLMSALPDSEYARWNRALLEDRVRVHEGLPQRYGTQTSLVDSSTALVFDPIEDIAHLEERRASAGFMPLDAYVCLLHAMYGRPVKDPRRSGG